MRILDSSDQHDKQHLYHCFNACLHVYIVLHFYKYASICQLMHWGGIPLLALSQKKKGLVRGVLGVVQIPLQALPLGRNW